MKKKKFFQLFIIFLKIMVFSTTMATSQNELPQQSLDPEKYVMSMLTGLEAIEVGDSLLLKGIKLMENHQYKNAFEFLNMALGIAREEDNPRLKFLVKNNIGIGYFRSSEYASSLHYFKSAYYIARDKLAKENQLTAMNNIAMVYNENDEYEKALEFLIKAYERANKAGLKDKAVKYSINLGTIYIELQQFSKARAITEEALSHTEPGTINNFYAKINLAKSYEMEGQLREAKNILENSIKLNSENKHNQPFGLASLRLAGIHFNMGNYLKAREKAGLAVKASIQSKSIQVKYHALDLLSLIAKKLNDYQKAYYYLQEAGKVYREIQQLKDKQRMFELQTKFELSQYEFELKATENRLLVLQKLYSSIIIFLVLLALLGGYTMRVRWVNMKQKNYLIQKKQEIDTLELEKTKAQQLALEQKMRRKDEGAKLKEKLLLDELEIKNKEISSKALVSAAKNDILNHVLQKIEKINDSENNGIASLKKELKNTIDINKDWNDFVIHFEKTHSKFFQKLLNKHPHLNSNDLRFAAYLRINLNGKEIARLLNITNASYRKRKMRLKGKLELDGNQDLVKYIYSF